ncbi:GAF domain-containing protein [Streptomyces sp. A012304]|uniref:GAF domain-containing sensor histidine kinase n=1 Tax=Streptomyces sp. A012304 TaxID=375446 RepID=UPI002232A788|nr:GAF domain-containing protein [Streptomyces sp. A012304]GKQ39026.1 histidine kinase [Streptomyces sp. A012304]
MAIVVRKQQRRPPPDDLLELAAEYKEILALFDGAAAIRRVVETVPAQCGVDAAWVGEPHGTDSLVLRHTLNIRSPEVNGLVIPAGRGLGGQVLVERRPLWVRDYTRAATITHHFNPVVQAEDVGAMIAVPMVYGGRLLGVLYGANRFAASYDDRATQLFEQAGARAAAAAVVAERTRHAAEVAVHEERRRVALDLHDTVGAMLFTIGAGIRGLLAELPPGDTLHGRLSDLEQQAAEAAAVLRGSLHALNAPPDRVALGVALRGDCRAFQERTGIVARLITVTELPPLPSAHLRALTDTAKEALLNVEKHARARSVVVSVFAASDGVTVRIADDGVGLPPAGRTREGLGVAAMAERLARVGGRLSMGRNEDGGVTVQAWVPV